MAPRVTTPLSGVAINEYVAGYGHIVGWRWLVNTLLVGHIGHGWLVEVTRPDNTSVAAAAEGEEGRSLILRHYAAAMLRHCCRQVKSLMAPANVEYAIIYYVHYAGWSPGPHAITISAVMATGRHFTSTLRQQNSRHYVVIRHIAIILTLIGWLGLFG